MDKMFDIKITESIINQQEMFGTQSLAPIINQQDKMIEEFEVKINRSITGLDESVQCMDHTGFQRNGTASLRPGR